MFLSLCVWIHSMWLTVHDTQVCDKYMSKLTKNGLVLIDTSTLNGLLSGCEKYMNIEREHQRKIYDSVIKVKRLSRKN